MDIFVIKRKKKFTIYVPEKPGSKSRVAGEGGIPEGKTADKESPSSACELHTYLWLTPKCA